MACDEAGRRVAADVRFAERDGGLAEGAHFVENRHAAAIAPFRAGKTAWARTLPKEGGPMPAVRS